MKKNVLPLLIFLLLWSSLLWAQVPKAPEPVLDKKTKTEMVQKLAETVKRSYVLEDKGHAMSQLLLSNLKKKKYDPVTDPRALAQQLTDDLRSIILDRHMHVQYYPKPAGTPAQKQELMGQDEQDDNYGFNKLEILPGNIGYLKFNYFSGSPEARTVADRAMAFLQNTQAVIIDLRENGGGEPAMVQYIASYFFGEKPVLLNTIYNRPQNKTEEYWTLADLPGKRMPDKPVYVLTSHYSFSGAEELAYDLQTQKRATLIGEVTGGGANPVDMIRLNDQFVAMIPQEQAINPITKTNWEGTGVKPEIAAEAAAALAIAHYEAVKVVAQKAPLAKKVELASLSEYLNAKAYPVQLKTAQLQPLTGRYREHTITLENGSLYTQRGQNPKHRLVPLRENVFVVESDPNHRFVFAQEDPGKPVLETRRPNGQGERHQRAD